MTVETSAPPQFFSLRTPLLSEGQTTTVVAKTDVIRVFIKAYAKGGENGLHTHTPHDHTFVVLDGEATFHFADGSSRVVKKYEGVLLPRGCLHYFQSTGEGNLIMLKVNAYWDPANPEEGDTRIGADGNPLPVEAAENKAGAIRGVPIPGLFFGD
jgi:quercetin dioxygenase-like cupin family protein